MARLSVASINIQHSLHLERVTRFLQERKSEVVCLQELLERDVPHFESALGMQCIFAPMSRIPDDAPGTEIVTIGIGIFTATPLVGSSVDYYAGNEHDARNEVRKVFMNMPLVGIDVQKDGIPVRISTLHFTWTPKGQPSELQRLNAGNLLEILRGKGEFVFMGDFNAPRGGEIFSLFADRFRDNVPLHYQTSLDPHYHTAPPEERDHRMVDGIFSTGKYDVVDVAFTAGISDHLALTATIERTH